MKFSFIAAGVLGLFVIAIPAQAAPLQIAYDDIRADTFEDFQDFTPGNILSPVTFDNFTYAVEGAFNAVFIASQQVFCTDADDICLSAKRIDGVRTLSDFTPGTTFMGFELSTVVDSDPIQVTVTGVSGMMSFAIANTGGPNSGGAIFGFGDSQGLISIQFSNDLMVGNGNYSFDDIIFQIDDLSVVPLPAAMPLFLAGLGGLFATVRRRRVMAKA